MTKSNKRNYECKECKMFYKNKILAQKCEEWCKKYHPYNLKIIKFVIKEK